jgi:hypothetical protein
METESTQKRYCTLLLAGHEPTRSGRGCARCQSLDQNSPDPLAAQGVGDDDDFEDDLVVAPAGSGYGYEIADELSDYPFGRRIAFRRFAGQEFCDCGPISIDYRANVKVLPFCRHSVCSRVSTPFDDRSCSSKTNKFLTNACFRLDFQ